MAIRGAGRGGKAGGVKGPSSTGGPAKAGGASFSSKVDKTQELIGPSGAAASGEVASVLSADPVAAQALELIRQLRSGQLKSREEATRKFVEDILREKVRLQSKQVAQRIADQLKEDPRLSQTLERLWNRAQDEE